jgi:cation:H+ antiporter
MVQPLKVGRELMRREVPAVLLLQLLIPVLLYNGVLSRIDGLILVFVGIAYNVLLIRDAMAGRRVLSEDEEVEEGGDYVTNGALMAVGMALLLGGAELFVDGAVELAQVMGLDKRTIGLTVVALGTSAPEVITAVVSAYRGEVEMAVGNSLGSNILNVSMALGLTAMIEPIVLVDPAAWKDMAVAVLVTAMLVPVILRGRALSRTEGGLFVGAYLTYFLMVPSL